MQALGDQSRGYSQPQRDAEDHQDQQAHAPFGSDHVRRVVRHGALALRIPDTVVPIAVHGEPPYNGPTITRNSGRGNAAEFEPGTLTFSRAAVEVSTSAKMPNVENSGFLYVSKEKQNRWINKEKFESSITLGGLYTKYQRR